MQIVSPIILSQVFQNGVMTAGTLSISNFEYGSVDQKVKLTGDLTLDENLKTIGCL